MPDQPEAPKPPTPAPQPPAPARYQPPPMRRFGDYDATRKAVFDNALEAARGLPPVENTRYALTLHDLGYAGADRASYADHKRALYESRTLGRRLTGTVRLTDKASGAVVDARRMTLASVPVLTSQGVFVLDGTASPLASQMRLSPGVYARRKSNGELESHIPFLPGEGVPHRFLLDPETGQIKTSVGQAELPAHTLLKALGATDEELVKAWGPELAAVNAKVDKPHHLEKYWDRMGPGGKNRPDPDKMADALRQHLETFKFDPWVNNRTLGVPLDRYGKEAALRATAKLIKVARGEAEPDDRDNQAYASVWGPEHLIAERITRARPLLAKALWQATNKGSLKGVQPGILTPGIRALFSKSGLGSSIEGTNSSEFVDHGARITKVGEGGIGRSSDSAPVSARDVSPSQFLFVDPIRASESESVGLDLRVAFGTRLGADKQLYAPVLDPKTSRVVYRSPRDLAEATVAFPGWKSADTALVPAIHKGKMTWVPKDQIDYAAPSMEQSFSPLTNLVPLKSASKPHRASMGARYSIAGDSTVVVLRVNGTIYNGPIQDYEWSAGDLACSIDKESCQLEWKPVRAKLVHQNKKRMYRVTLKSGRRVVATADHSFVRMGADGYLEKIHTQDLQPRTQLPCAGSLELSSPRAAWHVPSGNKHNAHPAKDFVLDHALGWLHGLYLAEGSVMPTPTGEVSMVDFANLNAGVRQKVTDFFSVVGIGSYVSRWVCGTAIGVRIGWKQLGNRLVEDFGKGSYHKRVPAWVLGAPREYREGLISGYLSGDGKVFGRRTTVRVIGSSRSVALRDGLCDVLLTLGITANRREEMTDTGPGGSTVPHYSFEVPTEHLEDLPRLHHDSKDARVAGKGRGWSGTRSGDAFPLYDELRAELVRLTERDSLDRNRIRADKMVRVTATKLLGSEGDSRACKWLRSKVRWDRIASVEEVDAAAYPLVYDLDLEDNVFMCNGGVFVHNTVQALPLAQPEAPLVRTQVPNQPGKSFEELFGRHMGAVISDKPGTVTEVTPDGIKVRHPDGTETAHELYNWHPSGRKTASHNYPLVQVGQQVGPGHVLARSEFTDENGHGAYGANLRTAFASMGGRIYEDSVVVSQSAANRLTSSHLYQHHLPLDEHTKTDLAAYLSAFPGRHPLAKFKDFDKDGVIRPGTRVESGQPLILGVRKKLGEFGRLSRSAKSGLTDATQTWDHDEPGVVTDVTRTPEGITVAVHTTKPLKEGDKLCYDPETEVLTANGWKRVADVTVYDKVATLDPDTDTFEYLNPVSITGYHHTGRMYRLRSTRVDLLVTENHKLYADPDGDGRHRLVEARDLFGRRYTIVTGLEAGDRRVFTVDGRRADCEEYWADYAGMVHCVTMPKWHIIYVRRGEQKKPVWCGNSGRHGNKGVAVILPDHKMPTDAQGRPMDVILSSLGTISRSNPSAIFEAHLGKIAQKTGKPYVVDDFHDGQHVANFVDAEAKKHNVPFMETLTDPETGRQIPNVGVGNLYLMKLLHVAESKSKGRGLGGYDESGQPLRGQSGKAMRASLGDTHALLSHGSTSVLKDLHMYKGQANDVFWQSFMSGFPPPRPTTSKAFERFLTELKAAGVHPVRDKDRIHLTALRDHDVKELAGDREIQNGETLDFSKNGAPVPGGLFDAALTGGPEGTQWSRISLHEPVPNPVAEDPVRRLLGLTRSKFRDVMAGRAQLGDATGPSAILGALKRFDLDGELRRTEETARSGRKTARDEANRKLTYLRTLKNQGRTPADWFLSAVPVLPPVFRPIRTSSFGGKDNVIVSDPNLLYKDVLEANKALKLLSGQVGDVGEERLALYDAVKAAMGLGEPISAKNKERGVKGILEKLLGTSAKYCYDSDTEILTQRGWVRFAELKSVDVVATCNPQSGAFEWEAPRSIQVFDHEGDMVKFGNGRRGRNTVDLLVTPDHRHWYRPGGAHTPDDNFATHWTTAAAGEMDTRRKRFQTAARGWVGTYAHPDFLAADIDPLTFAEFVGLWAAEGWIHSYGTAAQIGQSHTVNEATCRRIRDLLNALRLPFSEGSHEAEGGRGRRGAETWWYIRSRALATWLRENIGQGSENKKFSRTVLDWPAEMLTALVAGYLAGDGSKRSPKLATKSRGTGATTNKNRSKLTDDYHAFGTCSRDLYDGLQEVFCKLGVTVRLRKTCDRGPDRRRMYYGSIVGRPHVLLTGSSTQKTTVPYSGQVYCCTTQNGLLFVRRNEVVCVSGNSYLQQKLLGTPADLSGRGQVLPNPDFDMDEVGVPESVAWDVYHPFIVRRLVQAGMPRAEAARVVEAREDRARRALVDEMDSRPVTITRYPALHRYSVIAQRPKLVAGDAIQTNPIISKGMGMDYDGNCIDYDEVVSLQLSKSDILDTPNGGQFLQAVQESAMRIPADEQVIINHADTTVLAVRIGDIPRGPVMEGVSKPGQTLYRMPDGVKVLTYDHDAGVIGFRPVTSLTVEDGHDTVRVTTRTDRQVTVSSNDSLCVFDRQTGAVRRGPAEVGAVVPFAVREPILGKKYDYEVGWWYGMLISDGWVNGRVVGLSKLDGAKRDRFVDIARRKVHHNFTAYTYERGEPGEGDLGENAKVHLSGVDLVSRVLDCYADRGGDTTSRSAIFKKIPDEILLHGSRECLVGLMAGLLDGDGTVTWNTATKNKRFVVRIPTSSPSLVAGLRSLSRKLGLRFSVTTVEPRGISRHRSYVFLPSVIDFHGLAKDIFLVDTAADAVVREFASGPPSSRGGLDWVPVTKALAGDMSRAFPSTLGAPTRHLYEAARYACSTGHFSRNQARAVLEALPASFTHDQLESFKTVVAAEDVGWDVVTKVEDTGKRQVFDLSVPDTRVFAVGSGIIVWDTVTMHVPLTDEAVKEAYEKMLPSKNLYSVSDFKPRTYLPNMEYVQGLHYASVSDNKNVPVEFRTRAEALQALKQGRIGFDTRVHILED